VLVNVILRHLPRGERANEALLLGAVFAVVFGHPEAAVVGVFDFQLHLFLIGKGSAGLHTNSPAPVT
jgi:hypothetical protein